ncbi:MAG: PAS domain S-box protein [Ignavibacteria bacterium]|nr:PAS domain S-box protein [Ignavibacteria bacterium]
MEKMVTKELDVYFSEIKKVLKRYSIEENDEDKIMEILSESMSKMIALMREGKSAHEKFFSDIILNSVDAIIGFDNNHKIFLWNKGAEDIFGYKLEEVTGKDFSILIPEYLINEGEKEFLIKIIAERNFLKNYETERITKRGEIITVSISRFAIFNTKREIIGSVGIVRDITKEKQLEKELREKENLALVGQVVSSIAHSLANPLNLISGNTEYLLMNKKPGEKDFDELKNIMEETNSISELIRSIMDFSRPLELKKEKLDISELLKEVLEKIKYSFEGKDIKIDKQIQGSDFIIFGDTFQLKDAFINLFINAIQSIKIKGSISAILEKNEYEIKFSITDTGSGIPEKDLPNIFKPFYSTKDYGKGTGLGLAITNKVIKEHGGSISVRSRLEKGTTFTIQFPF